MNDQHAHAGYVGHDQYPTGSFDTDPLFGALPGGPGGYETGHSGQYDSTTWDTGSHCATTAGYGAYAEPQAAQQTSSAQQPQQTPQFAPYDTSGQWDATAWCQSAGTGEFGTGEFQAGEFEAGALQAGQFETGQFETAAATFAYDATGQWEAPAFTTGQFESGQFDTGQFDADAATAWTTTGVEPLPLVPQQYMPEQEFTEYRGTGEFGAEFSPGPQEFGGTQEFGPELMGELAQQTGAEAPEYAEVPEYGETSGYGTDFGTSAPGHPSYENELDGEGDTGSDTGSASAGTEAAATADDGPSGPGTGLDPESGFHDGPGGAPEAEPEPDREPIRAATPVTPRPVRRASGGARGRRRTPAKRSALLTVAVPSACVMGVAGIAAASVGGMGEPPKEDTTTLAAADASSVTEVAANSKMDTQLAALSAEARDFGDRASRTQERIDLKARQEAERQKREEEAKRREALRPKFALPVQQKGLSTYYGQSGVNWMALHTGIDFPVAYGSEVMAATDGTVRTQFNSAYGNMVIVTAPDGTETWYCHLSSAKVRSGKVKAGDVIAYSGNSGNSTGPHLHFEVRPGGGSTINPLTWLQSHGLSPV
ncbi:peptidoglycan DD-metalloendopeptidase family protein [Streptomyces sp. NPDC051018]|uniref:M23 family metallopeptidase n=1 Tax=Streptomyces sp. NPDC051018 TaxID=3365639 RepID=UPI00378925F3